MEARGVVVDSGGGVACVSAGDGLQMAEAEGGVAAEGGGRGKVGGERFRRWWLQP